METYKLTPPKDFFKTKETNPLEIKRKIIENENYSKYLILIKLNGVIRRTHLNEEAKKIGLNSYPEKTRRILDKFLEMGVIECKQFQEIHNSQLSETDKLITTKHQNFLSETTNPFNQKYADTYYYYLSNFGEEIIKFVAEKLNFGITKE